MIRVFLALALFLGLHFDLIPAPARPAGFGLGAATGQAPDWLRAAHWLAALTLAGLFLVFARVGERRPPRRPGMPLLTLGLTVFAVATLGGAPLARFLGHTPGTTGGALRDGLALLGGLTPMLVALGDTLIALGLLRLLLDLDPLPPRKGKLPASAAADKLPGAIHVAELAAARDALAAQADDLAAHQRLHQLLLRAPQPGDELSIHARTYISMLCRRSQSDRALDVYEGTRRADAAFAPTADDVAPLADAALRQKNYRLAVRVVNRFDDRNPGHPSNPLVYLLAAKALLGLDHKDLAKHVLQVMLQRHAADAHAWEASVLLRSIAGSPPTGA